jgi:hypothetical protein
MKRCVVRPSALFGRLGLPASILAIAAFGPGQALASQPGVHLDPGSPAGKQYAIALSTARGSGGQPAALFGTGIVPVERSAAGGGATAHTPATGGRQSAPVPRAHQRVHRIVHAPTRIGVTAPNRIGVTEALRSPSSGPSGVVVGVIAPAILLVLAAFVAAGRSVAVRSRRST